MRFLVCMQRIAIDNKNIALLNEIRLVIDEMSGVTVQDDDKLGEVIMLVQIHVFIMSAVLDKEWKLLVLRKPVQINIFQWIPAFLFLGKE
ncbi:hypothetical protein D3C78_1445950 [compost metagenome]